ncbi:MAG: hypothetical protein GY737_00200 [Desulfobacteraceae bacterium]|nr:hypothetical protein [Desulfobacteraceae bacterium]
MKVNNLHLTEEDPTIVGTVWAEPGELYERSGIKLDRRILDYAPCGSRILVAMDPMIKQVGLIELPDEATRGRSMGSGWVIAAGAECGAVPVAYPGAPHGGPEQLVGQHIYFGEHMGKTIRMSMSDDSYNAGVVIMTLRDIWMVDRAYDPKMADLGYAKRITEQQQQKYDAGRREELQSGENLEELRAQLVGE